MSYLIEENESTNISVDVESLIDNVSGDMIEKGKPLKDAVEAFEKNFIRMVLNKVNGDTKIAAQVLKTDSNTIDKAVNSTE